MILWLYLEIVECFEFTSHGVHLVIVNLLYFAQCLSHFILPELAVLGRRIAVRECRQLLQLLSITHYILMLTCIVATRVLFRCAFIRDYISNSNIEKNYYSHTKSCRIYTECNYIISGHKIMINYSNIEVLTWLVIMYIKLQWRPVDSSVLWHFRDTFENSVCFWFDTAY